MQIHMQIEYKNQAGESVESLLDCDVNDVKLQTDLINEYKRALLYDNNARLVFGSVCTCYTSK